MTNAELLQKYANMPSGVYREIIDASQQADIPENIKVVVVGQFSKGPVMNPVYIKDKAELHAVFGKRDAKLEQRGCTGVLQSEHLLEQGPIWVINIKNIDKLNETLATVHIARTPAEVTFQEDIAIGNAYDTSNFWKVDKLYATRDAAVAGLTLTSVLNETISVIVQKELRYPDFDYTVKSTKDRHETFMGVGLDESLFVSDYLITVHVFKSDISQLLNTGNQVQCFHKFTTQTGQEVIVCSDSNDSSANSLEAAINNPKFKYYKSYDGAVADVIDIKGNNLNIALKINSDTLSSGLSCALNFDGLIENGIDLLGLNSDTFDIETYPAPISGLSGINVSDFPDNLNNMTPQQIVPTVNLINGLYKDEQGGVYALIAADDNAMSYLVPSTGQPITEFWPTTGIKVGQKINIDGTSENKTYPIQSVVYTEDLYIEPTVGVNTNAYPITVAGLPYPKNAISGDYVYPSNHPLAGQVVTFDTLDDGWLDYWDGLSVAPRFGVFPGAIPSDNLPAVKQAYYLTFKKQTLDIPSDLIVTGTSVQLETLLGTTVQLARVTNSRQIVYSETIISRVYTLHGIVDLERHYVNGTSARQNEVLNQLNSQSIMNSFFDPTVFRCRYMIDTFKTYIEPNAKLQFGILAGYCKRFLVLTSLPFYYELLSSKNPNFHDELGQFQMSYYAKGTNPDRISTNSASFPNNAVQGSWLVPINPVLHFDGFSESVIPAVGAVGKLYYSKHTGTNKVYDIVGGKDWPIVASGVTAPEKVFDIMSRGSLESIGANIIQTVDGVLQLRSSKTAYQSVSSALNMPETIEKFLYLTDITEPVIESKQFKYNDINSRSAVLSVADTACQQMRADGAIADYLNTCDLTNNTPEVRSRGIIVLDTILYNEFGIRLGVHRTTVALPAQ